MTPSPWEELERDAARRLGNCREARWMVEQVSGGVPNQRTRSRLEEMVRRRLGGEPLQYVLGTWSFRTLELMVDRRVLIPRPETEQVVEVALQELRPGRCLVADLGTGSGAIALSIAAERKSATVWATDVDAGALAVASANLAGLGGFAATRVHLAAGNWFSALPGDLRGAFDLLVSNPPYVSAPEYAALDAVVADYEPRRALEAGPSGTECLEAILRDAPAWLADGGVVVLEIGAGQAAAVSELARSAGFSCVDVRPDLAGRPRILVARP